MKIVPLYLLLVLSLAGARAVADALTDADAYVAANRRGVVTVSTSLPVGTPVAVSLKRLAFNFGTATPGNSSAQVSAYLGSSGTAQQANYQAKLLENFNAVTMENAGKWDNTEVTRGQPTLGGVNAILDFAGTHGLYARYHNVFWDLGDGNPAWVNSLRSQAAAGSSAAKTDLRNAISARLAYLAPSLSRVGEADVYNESYQGQCCNGSSSYWNVFGAGGIASIYNEAHGLAPRTKMFVNEYDALAGNAAGYRSNISALLSAGAVIGGVGTEDYEYSLAQHDPTTIAADLRALPALPQTNTEFGVYSGVSQSDAATIVRDTMRLEFGSPNATGLFMWGFQSENGGGNLFAPAAALYTVSTLNWNSWTITPAGRAWQDQLGIHDWDGNPANAWTTQLTATTNGAGAISFDGYYGDYQLTGGGKSYALSISRGTTSYAVGLAGDFNGSGKVDAADYVAWRKFGGGDNGGGYATWRGDFGAALAPGTGAGAPEPPTSVLAVVFIALVIMITRRGRRKDC